MMQNLVLKQCMEIIWKGSEDGPENEWEANFI